VTELERLDGQIGELQKERAVRHTAEPFLACWKDAVSKSSKGRSLVL
jgi:hypothetical protein